MDKILLYAAVFLVIIGLVTVFSASSLIAKESFGSQFHFLYKQAIFLLLGILIALVVIRLDLKRLAPYSVPIVFVCIALLTAVFAFPSRNDAHRWINIGPFTLQPSEMFKLAIIYYLAFSLSQKKRNIEDWRQLVFPYAPLIGTGILLIIFEPGLGSALTITATVIIILFLAGMRLYHLALFTVPLGAVATFLIFVYGYKKARVLDYLSAIQDPLAGSFQVKQAILAMGAGGLYGAGLGNGRQKMFFLPYPYTDFIYASIGEEFGFIGLCIILLLFAVIVWRGIHIALYQPDRFGFLLAMGVTASIMIAVIINIGVVTTLLPTTGIPLPLISYGGTALLVSIASIAILLNLSRRKGVIAR